MKRDISELLDGYREEQIHLDGDTPLSPSRIKARTMVRLRAQAQDRQIRPPRRTRTVLARSLLIAAAVALLCCATVFAIAFSLRESAREDIGVSADDPIPEWSEYEGIPDTEEAVQEDTAALLAAMCSGDWLCVYLEVSPVQAEVAEILATGSPEYEWDLMGIGINQCTLNMEQVDYDPQTQTALVKVTVQSKELEALEELELGLELTHNLKPWRKFDPVLIPLTQSQQLSCPADIPVTNTQAQYEDTWGLRPDKPAMPAYELHGTISQIAICAGYLEIQLETPDLERWIEVSGADQIEVETPDVAPPEMDFKMSFLKSLYQGSWSVSVNQVMEGASLNYKDGTSVQIDDLPHPFAGTWLSVDGAVPAEVYEGTHFYRFTPTQAFDLREVESITICGREYFFLSFLKKRVYPANNSRTLEKLRKPPEPPACSLNYP